MFLMLIVKWSLQVLTCLQQQLQKKSNK